MTLNYTLMEWKRILSLLLYSATVSVFSRQWLWEYAVFMRYSWETSVSRPAGLLPELRSDVCNVIAHGQIDFYQLQSIRETLPTLDSSTRSDAAVQH